LGKSKPLHRFFRWYDIDVLSSILE
jgi:hypothetical protein